MLPKTIVLHYKKLQDRKSVVISQLENNNFTDYSFYELYDQNDLTPEIINKYYVSKYQDPIGWIKKVSLWGSDALHYHKPKLNLAEISLTIKFGKAFEMLSQQQFDYCIIFEDDILLCDNFESRFYNYLEQTPKDWDAIYFGCCANLRPQFVNDSQVAYIKNHPASRGADSILLKHKTIVDLASTWFPFNLVSDWELGFQHYYHNHRVYWWEPSLVKQGSETGLFKSELR